jgi:predicted kinase
MKTILILKGLPASGKSTYAKQLVAENPNMYKRINRDDLRFMFDDYKFSKGNEKFVKKVRDILIMEALHDGKHVIVDDTNLSPKNEIRIRQLAKEYTAETGHQVTVKVKEFEVDLEECIRRDLKRARSVGEKVIRQMYKQWKGEDQKGRVYAEQNEDLPKAIVCDLDGTLSIIHDRSPFDGAKCEQDLPNWPVINLVKNYRKLGYTIIFLSGRQGEFRKETEAWIAKHGIEYDHLWMRAPKDNRKDSIIKRELFENNIKDQFYIEFMLDDRNQVVDLWRKEMNLPCFQVYYGDF